MILVSVPPRVIMAYWAVETITTVGYGDIVLVLAREVIPVIIIASTLIAAVVIFVKLSITRRQ